VFELALRGMILALALQLKHNPIEESSTSPHPADLG
jgi:hypothetical protein